ncbi:MAG: excinuclease ABC subunit UvrC [Thaumarchaeota archaeon]|nr:excinuclease ABC subunit UvrC [Nitrososphaerota archaeon]MCL5316764.1 excinuclease ABC subunit UvrC [Nitrososphaerota archaeon]
MMHLKTPSSFKSREIPSEPGVYLFKDEKDTVLYVGKAKNLRKRVSSYFLKNNQPIKTRQLVSKSRNLDWIIVNNEVEALLLENKLIKQHTPKYNINLKDAKTFAYIALTREAYPRLLTSRRVSPKLESFGPYTDGYMRQDLTRLVQKVFKIRTCRKLPKRACLNYHINLCTAPCIEAVSKEWYNAQVEQACRFLKGDYAHTLKQLNKQMKEASNEKKYERALELRDQIQSIQLLTHRQIVDNERRFDQDVMVFRQLGEKLRVVQMGVRKGVLLGKKEFTIDLQPQIEQEFLKAYYTTGNQIPREILLNKTCWTDNEEKNALEKLLSTQRNAPVTLTIPQRGDKLALVKLAEKNIESNLKENTALLDLQTNLNLPTVPRIIECFDISNLGEEHIVSGMVRFKDAKPDKNNYRKFKIKTLDKQDDFAAINEAVKRRYKRLTTQEKDTQLPDLIVIDGGSQQVNAAKKALQTLGLNQLPLIGLAKEHEEIYLPDQQTPRQYNKNTKMMLLLRQIRDATHNFSLSYNRKRRQIKLRDEFKEANE